MKSVIYPITHQSPLSWFLRGFCLGGLSRLSLLRGDLARRRRRHLGEGSRWRRCGHFIFMRNYIVKELIRFGTYWRESPRWGRFCKQWAEYYFSPYTLDIGGTAVEVDDALVNFHYKVVPGICAFSTGRLSGGDVELLGRDAHRPSGLELLLSCLTDEIWAGGFKRLDEARLEGDSQCEGSLTSLWGFLPGGLPLPWSFLSQ